MAAWKYIKGSEKDFLGAPEWSSYVVTGGEFKNNWFLQSFVPGAQRHQRADSESGSIFSSLDVEVNKYTVIAQRERVTSINDDRLAQDMSLPRERIHKPDANPVDPAIRYIRVDGAMFPDTNGEWVKTDTSTYEKIKPLVTDVVNHPKHYTRGCIECIDAIKAATVGKSGIEAACVANVVKYLWRYEEKNGVEDVKKARWYLERLISELESVK